MRVYPLNIKCAGCLKGIFLLLLMAVALHGQAQTPDKLPDSVNVSEEVSPAGAGDSLPGVKDNAGSSSDNAGLSSDSQSVNTAVPDSIVLRSVPDSTLSIYKKDKDFEYANDPAYWKHDSLTLRAPARYLDNGKPWGLSLRMLVFIIIAGVLLALLYRQYFYKDSLKTGMAADEGGEGETEDGFDDRIREALQAKDYRMGTRYLFLKTLQMLDKRQLIHYQTKATNREYVLQMSGHRAGARFRFLADAYDHVWYGDFLLSEQQFGSLQGYFEDFFSALSNEK